MPKPKPEKNPASPAKPGIPAEAAAALAVVEPELEDVKETVAIHVAIPRAVSIAFGAVPHLTALRPRFVDELPKHPIQLLDKLGTYALAA